MGYRDDPQVQTMIGNMPAKTGRALGEWIEVLAASGAVKHGQLMKVLKGEHGVTHGFANMICLIYREEHVEAPPAADDLVAIQYEKKQSLTPIYNALVAAVRELGDDVVLALKKKNVSVRRKKQFALIQPSTKSRIDLGLQLKGIDPGGRLEQGKMWGGMCSHRVQLTDAQQVDAEVLEWLQQAYDRAG